MALLSTMLPQDQMLTKWSSILNPLISNQLNSVVILPPYKLSAGVNVINTLLSKMQSGWMILDVDAAVTIHRSAPFNNKTLTLTSSGPANVILGVY